MSDGHFIIRSAEFSKQIETYPMFRPGECVGTRNRLLSAIHARYKQKRKCYLKLENNKNLDEHNETMRNHNGLTRTSVFVKRNFNEDVRIIVENTARRICANIRRELRI